MNRRVPRLDLVQKIVEQAAKGNGGRFPIALHALGAGFLVTWLRSRAQADEGRAWSQSTAPRRLCLITRASLQSPLAPILIEVQLVELAWVGLNHPGIERTTTDATVRILDDVHLAYMPYSLAAVGAWLVIEMGFRRAGLGRAIALGIASHLIRDRLTHDCEIVLWPGLQSPEQSTGPQATARP